MMMPENIKCVDRNSSSNSNNGVNCQPTVALFSRLPWLQMEERMFFFTLGGLCLWVLAIKALEVRDRGEFFFCARFRVAK